MKIGKPGPAPNVVKLARGLTLSQWSTTQTVYAQNLAAIIAAFRGELLAQIKTQETGIDVEALNALTHLFAGQLFERHKGFELHPIEQAAPPAEAS